MSTDSIICDSSSSSDSYDSDSSSSNNNNEIWMVQFYNIVDDGKCNVTWEIVMQDLSIKSIQEPISEMHIEKFEFHRAYGEFLSTLDGRDMSSYVDFFWRRSPVDHTCLEFIDKDCKMDIYEYLREENLIPDMKLVHNGDWKFQTKVSSKNNKGSSNKSNNKGNNKGNKKKGSSNKSNKKKGVNKNRKKGGN